MSYSRWIWRHYLCFFLCVCAMESATLHPNMYSLRCYLAMTYIFYLFKHEGIWLGIGIFFLSRGKVVPKLMYKFMCSKPFSGLNNSWKMRFVKGIQLEEVKKTWNRLCSFLLRGLCKLWIRTLFMCMNE